MQRCATCGNPAIDPFKIDEHGNVYHAPECYDLRLTQELLESKAKSGAPFKLPGYGSVPNPVNNSRKAPKYADEYKVNPTNQYENTKIIR
jgi:hypothetical protein